MPKTKKPHLAASTSTGSVAINPRTLGFQSIGTVEFSTDDPWPVAKVYVYGNASTANGGQGVLMEADITLLRDPNTFVCGPTPGWSGGGGDGLVRLVHSEDGVETLIAENTFTVVG